MGHIFVLFCMLGTLQFDARYENVVELCSGIHYVKIGSCFQDLLVGTEPYLVSD